MPAPSDTYPVTTVDSTCWRGHSDTATEPKTLIDEEPLSIRIQGKPYVVVMRTPGAETAHAAGLCLAEGIVDTLADIGAIAVCDGSDGNVVTVTLTDSARDRLNLREDRREWVSQTSCGICGKELVEELHQEIAPVERPMTLTVDVMRRCMADLPAHQQLRRLTWASHAAALYSADGTRLTLAEDVGRHNALDKAVGTLFLQSRLAQADLLVLSSRISYELVQKAARARIPVIMAISRPTTLAVRLAEALGICLAVSARDDGLYVYTHGRRIAAG